jgi:cell division protein FtsA
LTGGGANLPGIAELGHEVTRLPVRIGYPPPLYGVSDVLNDPAYATGVGLLLWKMRNEGNTIQTYKPTTPVQNAMGKIFKFLS